MCKSARSFMEESGMVKLRRTLEGELIFAMKELLPSFKDLGAPWSKICKSYFFMIFMKVL